MYTTRVAAKLNAYGVAEHGVALLRNYLSGRSHKVRSRRQVFFLAAGYKREYLRDPSQLDLFSSMYLLPEMSLYQCLADDEQIFASDKDPVKLEMKLQCQLLEAGQWRGA